MIRFTEWSTRGEPDRLAAHRKRVEQDLKKLIRRKEIAHRTAAGKLSDDDRKLYIPSDDHPVKKRFRSASERAKAASDAAKRLAKSDKSLFGILWHGLSYAAATADNTIAPTAETEQQKANRLADKAAKRLRRARSAYDRHIDDVRGGHLNPDGTKAHPNEFQKFKTKERVATRRIAKIKRRLRGDPKAVEGAQRALGGKV